MKNQKVLTVYFSWEGNTKRAAQDIQKKLGGDIFEIVPASAYPKDYNNCVQFAKEEHDANKRPAIKNNLPSIKDYDVVCLGYPIWWYGAPMIIYTFLENCDLSGKIVAPFCTSGGSSVEESMPAVRKLAKNAKVTQGIRIRRNSDIEPWLKKIGLL